MVVYRSVGVTGPLARHIPSWNPPQLFASLVKSDDSLIILDLLINHPGFNNVMSYISKLLFQLRMVPKVHVAKYSVRMAWLFMSYPYETPRLWLPQEELQHLHSALAAKQRWSWEPDTIEDKELQEMYVGMFVGMHSRCVLTIYV